MYRDWRSYLADIVMRQAEALGAGQPKWIWWRGANNRVLQEWLLSGQAYAVLERAFEASPSHPESGEWASACDVLEALGGRAPLQVSAPFDSTRA